MLKKTWMTKVLFKSCNTRNKMCRQALKGLIKFSVHKQYRNTLAKLLKAAKTKYFNKFFVKYKRNSLQAWTVINQIIAKKHK